MEKTKPEAQRTTVVPGRPGGGGQKWQALNEERGRATAAAFRMKMSRTEEWRAAQIYSSSSARNLVTGGEKW
jgi:hypothetical protein